MTERKRFGYTTSTTITTPLRKTDTYTYDSTWKDLLTGYNGTNNIRYDVIGNPTDYLGKTLVWTQGRRRKSVNGTVRYRYNESGLRISKTENGVATQSFWLGSQLMSQSNTNGPAREFVYWYDQSGNLVGFRYNGTHYYYVKHLQGDVIGILDSSHNVVARYAYDTWGKLLKITDGSGNDVTGSTTHIGYLNPMRYYYDNETGFYCTATRYYDPETGRFINADDVMVSLGAGMLNLYSYCLNNPVNMADYSGYIPVPVIDAIVGFGSDMLAGLSSAAFWSSAKSFLKAANTPMYLKLPNGGGALNPSYLQAMNKATNLQYGGCLLGAAGKVAKVAGYALVALDCGLSIYNNFSNPNLSFDRKVTDSIVDVSFSVGTFLLCTQIGGAIGTAIPVPIVGTLVGAAAGAVVGLGVYLFQETSLYTDIKVGFNNFVTDIIPDPWNNVVNGWNSFWSFSWA